MYLTNSLYEEYYLKLGLFQNTANRCIPLYIFFLNSMERRKDKFLSIKRSYDENWLCLAHSTYTAT